MTREGGVTSDGQTKTTMMETTKKTKTVTMTTTMNDEDDDVNERWRFNNQLA